MSGAVNKALLVVSEENGGVFFVPGVYADKTSIYNLMAVTSSTVKGREMSPDRPCTVPFNRLELHANYEKISWI